MPFPQPGPRKRASAEERVQDRLTATAFDVVKASNGENPWAKLRDQKRKSRPASPTPSPSPSPLQAIAEEFEDEARASARVLTDLVLHEVSVQEPDEVTEALGARVLSVDGLPERSKEERRVRRHANSKSVHREERRFDQTALHWNLHSKQVSHADYIAHCEKYDYAWRSIVDGDRILDVGCGTDAPLLKAINFVQAKATKILYAKGGCYVGVDLNQLKESRINWGELIGETDLTSEEGYERALAAIPGNRDILQAELIDPGRPPIGELRGYTMIVCLEVIEHMDVADGKLLLQNMHDLLAPNGRILLSTPVYDGRGQARNHIHEYYVDELQELIESVGLEVRKRMGTFTAEPQLKGWLKVNRPDWYELYMEAREFHSSGYMSGVLAPMVPDLARNNLWELVHLDQAAIASVSADEPSLEPDGREPS